jgi:N-methylhydantoinase A/oxoprolinase/acetone carboxylase beta subunit
MTDANAQARLAVDVGGTFTDVVLEQGDQQYTLKVLTTPLTHESAGAEPGPACYDQGGDSPTVTDADVILGRIEPDRFAGSRVKKMMYVAP